MFSYWLIAWPIARASLLAAYGLSMIRCSMVSLASLGPVERRGPAKSIVISSAEPRTCTVEAYETFALESSSCTCTC